MTLATVLLCSTATETDNVAEDLGDVGVGTINDRKVARGSPDEADAAVLTG